MSLAVCICRQLIWPCYYTHHVSSLCYYYWQLTSDSVSWGWKSLTTDCSRWPVFQVFYFLLKWLFQVAEWRIQWGVIPNLWLRLSTMINHCERRSGRENFSVWVFFCMRSWCKTLCQNDTEINTSRLIYVCSNLWDSPRNCWKQKWQFRGYLIGFPIRFHTSWSWFCTCTCSSLILSRVFFLKVGTVKTKRTEGKSILPVSSGLTRQVRSQRLKWGASGLKHFWYV